MAGLFLIAPFIKTLPSGINIGILGLFETNVYGYVICHDCAASRAVGSNGLAVKMHQACNKILKYFSGHDCM